MKTSLILAGLVAAAAIKPIPAPGTITLPLTARRASRPRGPIKVAMKDWINGTDLQWYAKMSVGTPAQHFNVFFDTGSYDLLLGRSNCTTCGAHALFDPSRSRTFQSAPGVDLPFGFVTGADQFPMTKITGKGHGTAVTDAVQLAGLSNPAQVFALSDVFPPAFAAMEPDGVLGLAPVNASTLGSSAQPFYWHLWYTGQLAEPTFAWYVAPGHGHGSELTLGGTNPRRYEGEIAVLPLNLNVSQEAGQWIADQVGVVFDSTKVPLNLSSGQPFRRGIAILDTGTAYIQPPDTQTVRDLYAAISPRIQPIGSAGSWGAPCDVLDEVAVDITFQLGPTGGLNVTLPRADFNLGPFPGQTELCEGVFVEPFGGVYDLSPPLSSWLLGSPLLKNYYTTWEGLKYEVGFAKPRHR